MGKRGHHPNSLANLHPYVPGQSGNPGGRLKGFTNKIKACCGEDYDRLVDGLYLIAFGTAQERKAFFGAAVRVSTRDRLAAIVELRDSGPGRPAVSIEVDERATVPTFALPSDTPGVSTH